MAITDGGAIGGANNKTANQSSFTLTTTAAVSAGQLVVFCFACDNNATTDGDEGAVSSVTFGSESATKAVEFTNSQGSAQAGTTVSVWYKVMSGALASSSSITANLTNNTSRDACAGFGRAFSIGTGAVALDGTPTTLANDNADVGSLNLTTSGAEVLRIRASASESGQGNQWATTTNFTNMWPSSFYATTGGGGDASNQGCRGEFRITTNTSDASDPTLATATVDNASVYVAFMESTPAASLVWRPTYMDPLIVR